MNNTTRQEIICVENGNVYPSIGRAADAVGVTSYAIKKAIAEGIMCKGYHWQFGLRKKGQIPGHPWFNTRGKGDE